MVRESLVTEPSVVMRNMRQVMNGLKNYTGQLLTARCKKTYDSAKIDPCGSLLRHVLATFGMKMGLDQKV